MITIFIDRDTLDIISFHEGVDPAVYENSYTLYVNSMAELVIEGEDGHLALPDTELGLEVIFITTINVWQDFKQSSGYERQGVVWGTSKAERANLTTQIYNMKILGETDVSYPDRNGALIDTTYAELIIVNQGITAFVIDKYNQARSKVSEVLAAGVVDLPDFITATGDILDELAILVAAKPSQGLSTVINPVTASNPGEGGVGVGSGDSIDIDLVWLAIMKNTATSTKIAIQGVNT